MGTSRNIAKAIMADDPAERQMWGDIEICRYAASRAIFCSRSGVVLDTRTVVVVTLKKGDATATSIYHGDAWDEVSAKLAGLAKRYGAELEITDGRALEAQRLELVKAQRAAKRAAKRDHLCDEECPYYGQPASAH